MLNGQNNAYEPGRSNPQGGITHILEEHFASNHLLTISLVHQIRNRDYKKPFFAFLKGAPAGKNGNNKTYLSDRDSSINFKLELHQLSALGKAFELYGLGSGSRVAPKYTIWADPSKTDFGSDSDKGRSGKSFSLCDAQDSSSSAQAGDRVVRASFNRGQDRTAGSRQGKSNYENITIVFKPFEALAIASAIAFMVNHARQLIIQNFQPPQSRDAQSMSRHSQNEGRAPQAPPLSASAAASSPPAARNTHQYSQCTERASQTPARAASAVTSPPPAARNMSRPAHYDERAPQAPARPAAAAAVPSPAPAPAYQGAPSATAFQRPQSRGVPITTTRQGFGCSVPAAATA